MIPTGTLAFYAEVRVHFARQTGGKEQQSRAATTGSDPHGLTDEPGALSVQVGHSRLEHGRCSLALVTEG